MNVITPGITIDPIHGLMYEVPSRGKDRPYFVAADKHLLSKSELVSAGRRLAPQFLSFRATRIPTRWSLDSQHAYQAKGSAFGARAVFNQILFFLGSNFATEHLVDLYILVLATLASYEFPLFSALPIIHLLGPPDGGKSRALELLSHICFNGKRIVSPSLASVLRRSSSTNGTLLFDERLETSQFMVDVLRASYRADITVDRAGRGPFDIVEYSLFGIRFCATNNPLRDEALATRTIVIHCPTGLRPPVRYNANHIQLVAAELRDRLHHFGLHYASEIACVIEAGIDLTGQQGRFDELLEPLAAVARVVDKDDPQQPSIEAALKAWAVKQRQALESFQRAHSASADFAAGVASFVGSRTKAGSGDVPAKLEYVSGPDLARFLFDHAHTSKLLDLAQLGKRLSALGLIVDQRREEHAYPLGRTGGGSTGRAQCTAYAINITRAKALAKNGDEHAQSTMGSASRAAI